MAITSVAGASLVLTTAAVNSEGKVRLPRNTAEWQRFTASGWFKTPSVGARTIFDYTTALQIDLDASNFITLTLDGSVVGTGATVVPVDTWFKWVYRKTSSGTVHTLKIQIDVDGVLGSFTTEVSVTQAVASGVPADLTLHVPAGCSVCSFTHAHASTSFLEGIGGWSGQYVLRFPGDLYAHDEHSSPSGAGSDDFFGMFDWTTRVGSFALDAADPESLLDQWCTAFLGIVDFDPNHIFSAPDAPAGDPTPYFSGSLAAGLTLASDVLPSEVIAFERIAVGNYAGYGSGIIPGRIQTGIVYGGASISWAEIGTAGGAHGYYHYTAMSSPSPLPDTIDQLLAASWHVRVRWNGSTGAPWGPDSPRRDFVLGQVGVAIRYIGSGVPASVPIIGPLVWVHMTRRT